MIRRCDNKPIKAFRVESFRDGNEKVGDWVVIADDSSQALVKTRLHYPAHKDCILTASELEVSKDMAFIELNMRCGTFI